MMMMMMMMIIIIMMTFNTDKTDCMVANPYDPLKLVCQSFCQLKFANCNLQFVSQFKYLGHVIDHNVF